MFVTRVNTLGALLYSTYLGGAGTDQANDLVATRRVCLRRGCLVLHERFREPTTSWGRSERECFLD
jgi:hypothetical protein